MPWYDRRTYPYLNSTARRRHKGTAQIDPSLASDKDVRRACFDIEPQARIADNVRRPDVNDDRTYFPAYADVSGKGWRRNAFTANIMMFRELRFHGYGRQAPQLSSFSCLEFL